MKSQISLCSSYYLRFLIPFVFFVYGIFTAYGQMTSPRLRLAQNLLRNNEYQEALNIFREIAQSEPRNIFVIRGMEECFRELQDFDQLITLLTRTVEQYPGDMNWQVDLAEAYYLNDNCRLPQGRRLNDQ
jgi:tetratricopeptide (TPR) repeat protein